MAKQYPKNPRAESARGYGPTPDADAYQGEKPGPEGWGARERSQKMNNAQLRSLQVMIDAGIDPDHAYLITIGQHSLTQAEHDQVASAGKNRRAPPKGSSPADLDPLEGAPAGEMPVDRQAGEENNFNPQTGKYEGFNRRDPTAPRDGDGMGEAEGYRGTIPYGQPGWDQQDPRTADERAAGRERVQRGRNGAYNDETNHRNNPDGYTLEEQRLNAQVLSPRQQEEKRRAEQDAGAALRRSQRKPKYNSQNGELLQDHQLERNGWRQVGPDARKRYTATDTFPDGSSNGVESQARIDARNGIVRNKEGQVLRMGPDGIPVYGPDRFRDNQRPDVPPKPSGKPQGGGQMSVPPEDLPPGFPRFAQPPKDDQPEVLTRMERALKSQAQLFPEMVKMARDAGGDGISAIRAYEQAVKVHGGEYPTNWEYVSALSEPGVMDQIPSLYPDQGSPQSPPIKTMPYVIGQEYGNPDSPPIQTMPARRDVGQGKPQPAPIALMQSPLPPQAYGPQEDNRQPMRQKWSNQTGPAPSSQDFIESPPAWARPPVAGQPAAPPVAGQPAAPPAKAGQMAIPPEEGDGYGPPVGGRQLGEGLDGGTDQQRELRIRRIARTRGVPAAVVRQEIEAAEAAGAASGEFGYNSARAWRDPLQRARDVRDQKSNEAAARFKNQAMYGPAGRAMNLVNDTQFSNDPSPAGQWKNYMMAQALLNPEKGIVDPNAVTAANGERAFALASRMAGNAAFNGQHGAAEEAQREARIDKAHEEFYKQDHAQGLLEGPDTPEERNILIEDLALQYQGRVSRAAIAAHLNKVRKAVQRPGTPPGAAPSDPGAGGSFQ